MSLIDHLDTEADLDAYLSLPSAADAACCRRLDGDVLVLGAAGKMGPSPRRSNANVGSRSGRIRVIAASRFSSPLLATCARRRRRDHDCGRPARSGQCRRAARQHTRAVSRRTQVRIDRQYGADVGHEHDRTGEYRAPFCTRAHRHVLDRQRVPVRARVVTRQRRN